MACSTSLGNHRIFLRRGFRFSVGTDVVDASAPPTKPLGDLESQLRRRPPKGDPPMPSGRPSGVRVRVLTPGLWALLAAGLAAVAILAQPSPRRPGPSCGAMP